jgi:MYXO-CTERM domain-containing protein
MMGPLLDVETPMLAPFMLGLSLMTPTADAAGSPKLIRYDSYADDGDIIVGAYFQQEPGFGKNSCMAQVYSFDEEDFPLVPTELRMFWAGEGAGEASELLLMVYFYWYEGREADQYVMRAGQYRLLDQEEVLLTNIPNDGVWVDLDLELSGFDFDGDPDTEGKQPIEYGSIIATVCYENAQYSPALAMDTDGWKAEPLPEESDDFIEGHDTSQFRSLIYWNGLWDDLNSYLMNTFGFGDGGDFIMRLVISANWDDYGQEETGPDGGTGADGGGGNADCKAGDWDLLSVEPDIIDPGTRTTVFIGSTYLVPANSTATIGSWALLDAVATLTCGLTGATDPDMEPGTYDVTIEAPDGTSRVLEDGFTVGEEPEGCGCSASTASSALWWAPLLGLGVMVRRRDD